MEFPSFHGPPPVGDFMGTLIAAVTAWKDKLIVDGCYDARLMSRGTLRCGDHVNRADLESPGSKQIFPGDKFESKSVIDDVV